MEPGKVLYLSRQDVEKVGLSMGEIIDALESMFKEKGNGRVEMPPKPGIHPLKDSFIHAMPAYIPKIGSAGIKWVSGVPRNPKKGLPYISGLIILNDPKTGFPIAIMDASWITAKRTGAATAVAAKYLANKDSSSVGILACGVQGRSNLEALATIFDIRQVKAFDIIPKVAREFVNKMKKIINADLKIVSEPKKAVQNMDLVVTSGPLLKNPKPIIKPDWISAGTFASPVDFDSYFTGAALQEMDKFATDDIKQMEYYRITGYFKNTPKPYADLGEIIAGKMPGRESRDERILCMNLGLALNDMATAILVYQKALKNNIGQMLPL